MRFWKRLKLARGLPVKIIKLPLKPVRIWNISGITNTTIAAKSWLTDILIRYPFFFSFWVNNIGTSRAEPGWYICFLPIERHAIYFLQAFRKLLWSSIRILTVNLTGSKDNHIVLRVNWQGHRGVTARNSPPLFYPNSSKSQCWTTFTLSYKLNVRFILTPTEPAYGQNNDSGSWRWTPWFHRISHRVRRLPDTKLSDPWIPSPPAGKDAFLKKVKAGMRISGEDR